MTCTQACKGPKPLPEVYQSTPPCTIISKGVLLFKAYPIILKQNSSSIYVTGSFNTIFPDWNDQAASKSHLVNQAELYTKE